ncbi:MAG: O-antigen ligase family protein [Cryomorphaceae bacterium]|nr:O-antigen ligase family protein [Cryomorphaceae bacterium]
MLNKILIFILISFSGISYFSYNPNFTLSVFFFLLIIVLFKKNNNVFQLTPLLLFIFAFTSIVAIQLLVFAKFDPYFLVKFPIFQFGIPVLVLMLLPVNFHAIFVKFVYYWTFGCLLIWIAINFIPVVDLFFSYLPYELNLDPFEGKKKSLIFFTYEPDQVYGIYRFAGFWHEPGAFSVLLFYSWYFSILVTGKLFNKYSKLFLLSIIFTFSTTAYFALMALLLYYIFYLSNFAPLKKIITICVGFLISLLVFFETEFMAEKVQNQYQDTQSVAVEGTATSGRFLSFKKALNVMYRYPLFGRGLAFKSKADITSSEHTGYGWPAFIANTGLILGTFFFIFFFKGIQRYALLYGSNLRLAKVFFIVFIILLFSQKHTSTPLFFSLFLFPFLNINQRNLHTDNYNQL